MSTTEVIQSDKIKKSKKKPLLKRWWFWILALFVVIIAVSIFSSGGESTAYELSKMQTMTKEEIITSLENQMRLFEMIQTVIPLLIRVAVSKMLANPLKNKQGFQL